MTERIIFKKGEQHNFLKKVKEKTNLSFSKLANFCQKHPHTVNDWYHEKASIPKEAAIILSQISKIPIPSDIEIRKQFWYTHKAGKIGGKNVITRHGNPGTYISRSLGGKNSVIVNKTLQNNFKQRKIINIPKKDSTLAELFGIILGDGGIAKYQLTITLHRITDKKYAQYVVNLLKNLFVTKVSKNYRKSVVNIVVSSTNLIEYLLENGLKCGSKVKNQIQVPLWIAQNQQFRLQCVRGLVDTDGCVYIDKHIYKGKVYKSLCLDFTNMSVPLLDFVWNTLLELGLKPKKYKKSLKLRRLDDIKLYFEHIGTSNEKHYLKYKKFINGEVA